MITSADFDVRQLRRVLGSFVTGVTVVTTVDRTGKPEGLTANSFTSVSLEPPLVLWNQSVAAASHPAFRDADRFAVNILAEHQVEVSRHFARPSVDKFDGLAFTPGLGGIPLIDGCAATLECRKVAIHTGGDHAIFIGQIERIGSTSRPPLVFGRGTYLAAHPFDLGELSDDAGLQQVQAVRAATPVLCALAAELQETLALTILTPHGPTVVRWEPAAQPSSTHLRMGVVPLLGSATGRLFAATMAPDAVDAVLRAQGSPQTLKPDIEAALREIRDQGHSISELAAPGSDPNPLVAIAVPVQDARADTVLAITALRRRDAQPAEAELLSRLKQAAGAVSARLRLRDPSTTAMTERTA